ncbi:MAG: Single-stranded DNA-specific exonuclease RecJ [Candidatus Methanohalarchaeum thermophilum]|uniref:Single-stranded DNA-specific exonuclease RecJ n=1 Tax=Methanohalarchaeum thermophilum TaxID=1903181 RepID=A0A1Q6DV96_METT1|nr:MAG: Single-stranded DNA-specific exonuclease RecJ [Candidatus Methanohalarchaeum thermophilum]
MKHKLKDKAKEISEKLHNSDFIRCISHNDADGITSAGILCNALHREETPFHVTIVGRPSRSICDKINQDDSETVIFFDMGSGDPEIIQEIDKDVIVVDHHPPSYKEGIADIHMNPYHFDVNGTWEVSAAGLSYLIAKEMNEENIDLSKIAIAGAVGDRQHLPMKGINLEILREAQRNNIIEVNKGISYSGSIRESLTTSTDPYVQEYSKDETKVSELIDDLGINEDSSIWEIEEEKKNKLIQILTLKLIEQGADLDRVKSIVGDVYNLNNGLVDTIDELTSLIDSSAREDKYGIALALTFGKKKYLKKAQKYKKNVNKELLGILDKINEIVKEREFFRFAKIDNQDIKGSVAGIAVDYLYSDKPFLALTVNKNVAVSARGNKTLLKKGLDLSEVMSYASKEAGGSGGGHDVASGARVPKENLSIFLNRVNEKLEEQLP